MTHKTIITAAILFFSFRLHAQTNKFIEVMVSDTISLKPLEFTYKINTGNDATFLGMNTERDKTDPIISINNIKRILDKNSFKYRVETKGNYDIVPTRTADSSILITLTSDTSLERLYKLLLTIKGIAGKISNVKYESDSPYRADIYKRLYSQAHSDAKMLATISGNAIGQLISVEEPKESDPYSGYMDMFKKMASNNNMFAELFGMEDGFMQVTVKKLLFKFELK